MIYRYNTKNNILKQNSLFQIPFKSANGYTVKIDNKILAEKLDYIIDGSRLLIERDIAGAVFSISDNVEDETETLLAKIGQLETNLNTIKSSVESNRTAAAYLVEALDTLNNLQSEKDDTYEEMFRVLNSNIDSSKQALETLKDSVDEDISALMDTIADVEHNFNSRIEQVLNTATGRYSALQKEIDTVNDKILNNKEIVLLKAEYALLSTKLDDLEERFDNPPESIERTELNDIMGLFSSLKQSLAMETAQRRRADMEIKLLLTGLIDDMDRLEDIIISNWEDKDLITGILDDFKKELIERMDNLSRVSMANMTRSFKIKQWIKEYEEAGL